MVNNKNSKAQETLHEILELYQTLVELSPDAIVLMDLGGKIITANQQALNLHGSNEFGDLIGQNAFDFIEPRDRKRAQENLQLTLNRGRTTGIEYVMLKKDGTTLPADVSASLIKDTAGKPKAYLAVIRDITERKNEENLLRENQRVLNTLLSNLPGMAYRCRNDQDWTMEFISEGCLELTGYKPEEIIRNARVSYAQVIHPDDREKVWKDVQAALHKQAPFRMVYRIIASAGEIRWVWEQGRGVFAPNGRLLALEGFITDITERETFKRELETLNSELMKTNVKLKQLALRDTHTNLYNHRYFEDTIIAEFDRARRHDQPLSVIMLDLDYFKSINEVYGHQFGDLLLKQLAQQLKRMVRKYDTVVRYGGEEFIVISPHTSRAVALILAQRLLDMLKLHEFGDKQHTVKLKLSMAVVAYPDDPVTNGMDFVRIAEKILEKVKDSGGGRVFGTADIKKKGTAAPISEEVNDVALLREKIEKLTKRTNQNLAEAIFAFAKTIEIKDHYTGEHVEKTVYYAVKIAKILGLPKEEIERVRTAAVLHDLGKIGVSEKILNKKTGLTKREYELIKNHPQIGVDILRPIHLFEDVLPLILYHHERWDGKGYPRGLKCVETPIGARIIAVADAFDALTSGRRYRRACSSRKAGQIIKKAAGTQFDPTIVDVLEKILEKEG